MSWLIAAVMTVAGLAAACWVGSKLPEGGTPAQTVLWGRDSVLWGFFLAPMAFVAVIAGMAYLLMLVGLVRD